MVKWCSCFPTSFRDRLPTAGIWRHEKNTTNVSPQSPPISLGEKGTCVCALSQANIHYYTSATLSKPHHSHARHQTPKTDTLYQALSWAEITKEQEQKVQINVQDLLEGKQHPSRLLGASDPLPFTLQWESESHASGPRRNCATADGHMPHLTNVLTALLESSCPICGRIYSSHFGLINYFRT